VPSRMSGDRALAVALVVMLALTVIVTVAAFGQHSNSPAAAQPGVTGSQGPAYVATATPSATAPQGSRPTNVPTTTAPPQAPSAAPVNTACSADPMAHVYRPSRLQILAACVTVSGTIQDIRGEADGDYHVLLALDPGQRCNGLDCLDDGNRQLQMGDLVTEVVCARAVTQADAIATCSAYHNNLTIPPVGSHVSVTGPWVFDAHGWNEIHPVETFGS